jgi:hypothetical protein
LYQWNDAVNKERLSRSREQAASAITNLNVDPEISLLLAIEATRV